MQLTPKQAKKIAKALQRRSVVGQDGVDIIEVFHATGKVLFGDKWPIRSRLRDLFRCIYPRVGGGNGAVQPAELAGAEAAVWKRIHAVNQALVGSGLLHRDFDTDDFELFPDPTDTDDQMTDPARKLMELVVGAYEGGAGGILTPDLEVLQPGESLGDANMHEASRRRRLAAAKQRTEEGLPPGFAVVGPRVSPHFDGAGWIPMFSEPLRVATHCVFRSRAEAVEHAWELRDGKFDAFLRPLAMDYAETDTGLEFDREAAVGKLRSMAETDPSNHSERKIHVCGHPGGLVVLCRDAGCEAIADVTSTGARTLSVDGLDVTAMVEAHDGRKLLQERLTPEQVGTLVAVVDALAEITIAPTASA